jgi:hypothetical protein
MRMIQGQYADFAADNTFYSHPFGLVHLDRFGRLRDDVQALLDVSCPREDAAADGE